MTDLEALALRCEGAGAANRDLDCLIARAIGAVDRRTATAGFGFGYVDRGQWACSNVLAYTASLDAAMSLVPEGHFVTLCRDPGGISYAGVSGYPETNGMPCATPALALCAAALRARALSPDKDQAA